LIFPTSGKAWVFGKEPRDVAVKHQIGFLPEESNFYRFLTARETLAYYGKLFQKPKEELKKRVNRLLERVKLSHAADRQVGGYSKGMARRVGLAQAMINNPDLVILDEPTSGLDPRGSREVKDLILEMKNEGKTVLITSHLLADIQDVCDRVAIVHHGKLQVCGEIEDLLLQDDKTELSLGKLSEEQQKALLLHLESQGITGASINHPIESLEKFFLRITEAGEKSGQTVEASK
jgi:ABC-2 type transport system ATP-binding protein